MINKTYILDLDHTLIYSSYEPLKDMEPIAVYKGFNIYLRPYAKELIKLLKGRFVLVYTSAKKDYASFIVNILFDYDIDLKSRVMTDAEEDGFGLRYYKSLRKLRLSEKDVMIIDDRPDLWKEEPEVYTVSSWHGEKDDIELSRVIIHILKQQPKIS